MIKDQQYAIVPVNVGKLLENQLKKWQGGGHHPRGIAEYITNSDDSYRRLQRFKDQEIVVEIHSRNGKMIDKLIVRDFAEGMSLEDLENKFFRYFESFSGREKGEKVTGRFGTGGKAYAIMNFRRCWIISAQNGRECKAWFEWDPKNLEIIKGYDDHGGYKNKPTSSPNGTTIILENSFKVNHQLKDFAFHLEKLARLRHILRGQKTILKIIGRRNTEEISLKYSEPLHSDALKTWIFPTPESLKESNEDSDLILRYFEKPLGENNFIDLSDGISSVADLPISDFDSRPFSKFLNGSLTMTTLLDSAAVKENRRGLEEGDDLTDEIENFIKPNVINVISEIESLQRTKDRERRIKAANEKLKELSKFLTKQDLKFKSEITELRKRFLKTDDFPESVNEEPEEKNDLEIYRKPTLEDPDESFVPGRWVIKSTPEGEGGDKPGGNSEFIPDYDGPDIAVKVGARKHILSKERKKKQGLQVLFSNDPDNPESPPYSEYDDPVSDRDMESKGIIWVNSVHPIILKFDKSKETDVARNENIANFVIMIVAQYYTQKELELVPEDERDEPLMTFRKHFFKLQREIREDQDIKYFKNDEE